MPDRTPPIREARIDLAALRRNVAAALTTETQTVVDLAGDAFGHGAAAIGTAALEAGAHGLRVRDDRERVALIDSGIDPRLIRLDPAGSSVDAATTVAIYGVGPSGGSDPVMRVSARVISVKTIDAGEPVSYGYTWRAETRSTLALVPLGYADGVMRSSSNRGRVWLAGAMRPVVGRVAMNVMVLDLGNDRVEYGEEAVLFGDRTIGGGVGDWAAMLSRGQSASISALEVTAGIGATVFRRSVG